MIDWRTSLRRWTLIALALGATGVLCRSELSTLLVFRGDALRAQSSDRAERLYERAILIDPSDVPAIDRIATAAILSHSRSRLTKAIGYSSSGLSKNPSDPQLLMDRALCFQLLGQLPAAIADFDAVAAVNNDPRARLFAADDTLRLGRKRESLDRLRFAVAENPAFEPLHAALRRVTGLK